MTTLEKELRSRNITLYRFAKLLGKNPYHVGNSIKNRVNGTAAVDMDELVRWCVIISEHSKRPLRVEDLTYKTEKVIIT